MPVTIATSGERVAGLAELTRLNQREQIQASWFDLVVSLSFWVSLPLLTWCCWRWMGQATFLHLLPYWYLGPWILGLVGVCWTVVWQLPQFGRLLELSRREQDWSRALAGSLQTTLDAERSAADRGGLPQEVLPSAAASGEELTTRLRFLGQALVTGIVLAVCWYACQQEFERRLDPNRTLPELGISLVSTDSGSVDLENLGRTLRGRLNSPKYVRERLGARIPAWFLVTFYALPVLYYLVVKTYDHRGSGLQGLVQSLQWVKQNQAVRWCAVRLPIVLLLATVYYFTLEGSWNDDQPNRFLTGLAELAGAAWPSFLVPLLVPVWALAVGMFVAASREQPVVRLGGIPSETP